MKKSISIIALFICTILLLRFSINAQVQEPPLAEVEYMKVTPGMEGDYLAGEAVWKKVHKNRIANKNILSWQLYRRVYPSGANVTHEYVTVTVYANAKSLEDKGNSFNWDIITKGMNAQEIFVATTIEKTRTIVGGGLYQHRLGAGTQAGKYLQIRQVAIVGDNRAEYIKMLTDINPTLESAIKNGKTLRRNLWEDMVASGPNFSVVYDYANLTDALKNSSGLPTITDEYEKLNPGKKWDAFVSKINSLYKITNHELWQLVDSTQQ
ncbi:MAG: hypothetical protein V4683_01960 [Bacteroidota bacterium]